MTVALTTFPDDKICTVLRAFLLAILPAGTEVIRGQVNRVSEPASDDFIVMTPLRRGRLATNIVTWDMMGESPDHLDHLQKTEVTVQLDVHGPNGTDNAQIISTLFRDDYACQAMAYASYLGLIWEGDGGAIGWDGESQTIIWYATNQVIYQFQPLYATDGSQMPFINGENQYEDRWVMNAVMQVNPTVSTSQDFAASLRATVQPPIGV